MGSGLPCTSACYARRAPRAHTDVTLHLRLYFEPETWNCRCPCAHVTQNRLMSCQRAQMYCYVYLVYWTFTNPDLVPQVSLEITREGIKMVLGEIVQENL